MKTITDILSYIQRYLPEKLLFADTMKYGERWRKKKTGSYYLYSYGYLPCQLIKSTNTRVKKLFRMPDLILEIFSENHKNQKSCIWFHIDLPDKPDWEDSVEVNLQAWTQRATSVFSIGSMTRSHVSSQWDQRWKKRRKIL